MAAQNTNVTKKEIVEEIAKRTGLKQTDVKVILEKFLAEIITAISNGSNIEIRGFGRFKVKPRKERIARNPRSGESIRIPAGIKPIFEPSNELKALLANDSKNLDSIQEELSKFYG